MPSTRDSRPAGENWTASNVSQNPTRTVHRRADTTRAPRLTLTVSVALSNFEYDPGEDRRVLDEVPHLPTGSHLQVDVGGRQPRLSPICDEDAVVILRAAVQRLHVEIVAADARTARAWHAALIGGGRHVAA